MAQQTSRAQGGVEQIRSRIRRIQREVANRRKAFEKELTARRRTLQKELARVQKQLARQPLVKRATALRADAQSRLEASVAGVLEVLPLATKAEIDRIDRKLRSIDRKLREMERSAPAA